MKYLKTFENKNSKNTEITFYSTSMEYGQFSKTIFNCILSGTPFDNLNDAKTWLDDKVDYIYKTFEFDIVFDWLIINFTSTDKSVHNIKIIKSIPGDLVFEDEESEESEKSEKPKKKLKNQKKNINLFG